MDLLIIAIVVLAAVDWYAVWKKRLLLDRIAKPGVIIMLVIWVWLASGFEGQLIWFAIGLLLSLIGDILLLPPDIKLMPGLAVFLLALLCYIIGLNDTRPPTNIVSLLILLIVFLPGVLIYRRLLSVMGTRDNMKEIYPVVLYGIILSVMLFSGLLTLVREDWSYQPALMVGTGALFFYLSDVIKGWDLYIASIIDCKLRVRFLYQLGQILIVTGAVVHFSS